MTISREACDPAVSVAARKLAAAQLRRLANESRIVGMAVYLASPEPHYREHADQLQGAADMMDGWAAGIDAEIEAEKP